jgi:small subunit ribosomal protein S2
VYQGEILIHPPVGRRLYSKRHCLISLSKANETGKETTMALPEFTMRQLLEAGVHFGHQKQRWNPKMQEFIYGQRNGIHIMDLTQTLPMLDAAINVVRETVAKGGRVLFVGTKRQAQSPIKDAAEKSAQFYMNHRWLGGTLTNWQTVSKSILRLKSIDEASERGFEGLTKKERLGMEREQGKLEASLGGIREMGGVPDLLFVIDVNKEALAIAEANKLGIPVVAVVDTNCSPKGIDYIIPGNDDAARAIALYTDLAARAALDGMTAQMGAAGIDIGEMEPTLEEDVATAIPATEDATTSN